MTRAVSRALSIFDSFDSDHLSLSLQEIGERIGMAKATTFRLVNTLEREGYLIRLQNQRYCLSLKLVRLAGLVHDNLTVREAARSVMVDLSRKTGETITLNARVHHERIVIDVVDTPSPLMAIARPGERFSLLYGAAGRVLLAYMPERDRDALLDADATIDPETIAATQADIAEIRARGAAVSRGQRVPGLSAISVPIFDHANLVQHCLALSGPSVRVDPRESEFTDLLRDAGRRVSSRLGMTAHGDPVLAAAQPSGPPA